MHIARIMFILLFIVPLEGFCQMPSNLEDLKQKVNHISSIGADSVYHYLLQEQSGPPTTSFQTLYKGMVSDTPILIYQEDGYHDSKIYVCTNPFVDRYPSTLLLWESKQNEGISKWFEADAEGIHTYMYCSGGELHFIAIQTFKICDGKFVMTNTEIEPLFPWLWPQSRLNIIKDSEQGQYLDQQ